MSGIIKTLFNVSSIKRYGNDGGTKVKLLKSREGHPEINPANTGEIEMFLADKCGFDFGLYTVTFEKQEAESASEEEPKACATCNGRGHIRKVYTHDEQVTCADCEGTGVERPSALSKNGRWVQSPEITRQRAENQSLTAVISQLKNDLFFAKSEIAAQHKTQARSEKKIQRLKSKNAHLKAKLALKDLPLKG